MLIPIVINKKCFITEVYAKQLKKMSYFAYKYIRNMSGIEEVAKSWLSDPPWQKVFKHTVDVIEDYISYILVCTFSI